MFSKKTLLLLLLLIITIGTVSSVSANDLADDAVSDANDDEIGINENNQIDKKTDDDTLSQVNIESEDDSGEVLKKNGKSLLDLQVQINNQFEEATISLDCDYYWDSSFEGASGIFIRQPLTINGNGHTLDAGGNTRLFIIYSDNVVLNNITFLNGHGADNGGNGGCICTLNNVTTLNDCKFINSTSENCGGAIATAGRLNLNNCYFDNNHAKSNGGAIYAYAPLIEDVSLNIEGCTFDGNWADSYGGAIYHVYYTNNGMVPMDALPKTNMKNTAFKNNEAGFGGAIFNSQDTDIESCQFTGNYAGGGGGAIYMAAGVLLTNNGKVGFAKPNILKIHGDTTFTDNYAEYYGGAIRVSSNDNYVSAGIKGILRVYGNVIFKSNYGGGPGGALSLLESDSIVENAQFIDNEGSDGSAMYGGTAINCVFKGNEDPQTYDTVITNKVKATLTIKQSGSYYKDKTLSVTLTNANSKNPIANKKVTVKLNGQTFTGKTNSKGVATISIPCAAGTYTATASVSDSSLSASTAKLSGIKIAKAPTTLTAKKLTAKKGKNAYFTVTVKNSKTKKVISGIKISIKVYTGKKAKTYTVKTDSKGIAKLNVKKIAAGNHNVVVSTPDKSCSAKQVKSTIKIK